MVKLIRVLVVISLVSCHEKLRINKKQIDSRMINMSGYYYGNNKGVNNILVLYQNGIIRYLGSLKTDDLNEFDKYIIRNYINNNPSNSSRTGWGLFEISNKEIIYEMWYPRIDNPVYRRKGIILNDSTFQITGYSKPNGKQYVEENIIYHFRAFSPKPDSVNNYIK